MKLDIIVFLYMLLTQRHQNKRENRKTMKLSFYETEKTKKMIVNIIKRERTTIVVNSSTGHPIK